MSTPGTTLVVAIDVGNSRTKFGFFLARENAPNTLPLCANFLAVPVNTAIPWKDLTQRATRLAAESPLAIVAGVNPHSMDLLLRGWSATGWPEPLVLSDNLALPLDIHVTAPGQVGIDRLLNAVAANHALRSDEPVIIVDSGTATTVDYVSVTGSFEGGAILPGLELAGRSLHRYTAKLPMVTPDDLVGPTINPLGKSTRDAMRSGMFWGHVGGIRELISRYRELSDIPATLLVTGGAAPLIAPHLKSSTHCPHLSMQGLAVVRLGDGGALH